MDDLKQKLLEAHNCLLRIHFDELGIYIQPGDMWLLNRATIALAENLDNEEVLEVVEGLAEVGQLTNDDWNFCVTLIKAKDKIIEDKEHWQNIPSGNYKMLLISPLLFFEEKKTIYGEIEKRLK